MGPDDLDIEAGEGARKGRNRLPRRLGPTHWRDVVPCYLSVQDRNLRILETNALFREDFGSRLGEHCYAVYKQQGSPCDNCPVLRVFEDGGTYTSEETVFTADGGTADMIVHAAPFRQDSRGRIVEVVEMSTNITEVRRLQNELAIMGRAVAEMAHRIKNIVMGLEGGIYVVNIGLEDGDDEAITKGWRMVEGNVDKVSRVVKDLLYCSKTREPNMQDGVQPVELLEEVRDLFRQRAADHEIELCLEIARSPEPGRYDPEGLHGLLTNLVANAMDACRFDPAEDKEHRIVMRCDVDPLGSTVIEVSDTGVGIPREMADKVFENYFSTKGTEGTGLGLLVARKIVEEHGGTIVFDSVENRGTVFRICLPPGCRE